MSIQPNTLRWDCGTPCGSPVQEHAIIMSDHEGDAMLIGIVDTHLEAEQVGKAIADYLEEWGDDEVYFIDTYEPRTAGQIIAMLQEAGNEMERELAGEKKEAGIRDY